MYPVFNESSITNFGDNQNITSNNGISVVSMLESNILYYLIMTITMLSVYILFYCVLMLLHLTFSTDIVPFTEENTNTIFNESISEPGTVIDIKGEYDQILNQIEHANSKGRQNTYNAVFV